MTEKVFLCTSLKNLFQGPILTVTIIFFKVGFIFSCLKQHFDTGKNILLAPS